jgi:hypothetical protein
LSDSEVCRLTAGSGCEGPQPAKPPALVEIGGVNPNGGVNPIGTWSFHTTDFDRVAFQLKANGRSRD